MKCLQKLQNEFYKVSNQAGLKGAHMTSSLPYSLFWWLLGWRQQSQLEELGLVIMFGSNL